MHCIYIIVLYNCILLVFSFVSHSQVLDELKKTNLTIQNKNIQFKPNGEFKYPSMTMFVWTKGGVMEAGSYESAYALLSINSSNIPWHTNGTVRLLVHIHTTQRILHTPHTPHTTLRLVWCVEYSF